MPGTTTTTAHSDEEIVESENEGEDSNCVEPPTREQFIGAIETIKKYAANANVTNNFIIAIELLSSEYLRSNPRHLQKQSLISEYFK